MKTTLTEQEIEEFKEKLIAQKNDLEDELNTLGNKNPQNAEDWVAVETDTDDSKNADKNEVADRIENYEGNTALLKQLEIEHLKVDGALKRIEEGTYGICAIGNEPIETDRLEANPSAETCKAHINETV